MTICSVFKYEPNEAYQLNRIVVKFSINVPPFKRLLDQDMEIYCHDIRVEFYK